MNHEFTKKQIVITSICLGCIFIGVITFASILYINRIGKVAVTVKYAPYSAEVTLNNQKLQNDAINYIKPGEYQLKITHPDFAAQTTNITINNDTEYLFGLLEATTEHGKKIIEEYAQEFYEVQGLAGMLANQYGEQQREEYPILKQLPLKNSLYSIGYTYNDQNPTITIGTYSVTAIDSAIEKLKSIATTVNDTVIHYNIKINEFDNLLEGKIQTNDNTDPLSFLKEALQENNFQIQTGKQTNNHYYTNIITGSEEQYTIVTYKIILVQKNDSWHVVGTPYPILTKYNTPDIPDEILQAANNFNG